MRLFRSLVLKVGLTAALLGGMAFSLVSASSECRADEVWIDGESVRLYLGSVSDAVGKKFEPLFDSLVGALLVRGGEELQAAVRLSRDVTVKLKEEHEARSKEIYQVFVPEELRLRIRLKDEVLSLRAPESPYSIWVKIKLPVIPDKVFMRSATVDLVSGAVRAELGVIGNSIRVTAKANLFTRQFEGIDLWKAGPVPEVSLAERAY